MKVIIAEIFPGKLEGVRKWDLEGEGQGKIHCQEPSRIEGGEDQTHGGCSRPGLEGNTGAAVILSASPSSLVQCHCRGTSDPGHCLCSRTDGFYSQKAVHCHCRKKSVQAGPRAK